MKPDATEPRPEAPQEAHEPLRLLSVVIPARDEEGRVGATVEHLLCGAAPARHRARNRGGGRRQHGWHLAGDCSRACARVPTLRPVRNTGEHGFGRAVTLGLEQARGDAMVVMMADESDDCRDVVRYWEMLNEGWDAVFGSRFVRGGGVIDYPQHKLILNRMANLFLRVIFHVPLNDFTNAFKAYRRKVIEGCRPFLSPHFNLTIEIPLKTIVRGYSWTVMPITWRNRRSGVSKLKIREMGSRYLFIALVLLAGEILLRAETMLAERSLDRDPRPINPARDQPSRDREGAVP